jgi:hypothetical protein
MNKREMETGRVNRNWISAIPTVRKKLNEYRQKKTYTPEEITKVEYPTHDDFKEEWKIEKLDKNGKPRKNGHEIITKTMVPKSPKFKVGDEVYYKLEVPHTALGKKQSTKGFREGDRRWSVDKKKIVDIFLMADKPIYRFYLDGLPDATFSDWELKK